MSEKTKITISKNGQVRVTVPKAIAGAMQFKNKDEVVWIFHQGDLIIRKVV